MDKWCYHLNWDKRMARKSRAEIPRWNFGIWIRLICINIFIKRRIVCWLDSFDSLLWLEKYHRLHTLTYSLRHCCLKIMSPSCIITLRKQLINQFDLIPKLVGVGYMSPLDTLILLSLGSFSSNITKSFLVRHLRSSLN